MASEDIASMDVYFQPKRQSLLVWMELAGWAQPLTSWVTWAEVVHLFEPVSSSVA